MKKETWKPVTISGFTGILMGAASSYGVQKAMASDMSADDLSDAVKTTAANDDLSFKHAFEAARAEFGPGAVFTWRGNLYNTYTAEEWNAMTQEEQQKFAEEVAPQVEDTEVAEDPQVAAAGVEEPETVATGTETPQANDDDVQVASVTNSTVNIQTNNFYMNEESKEDDVRVVGFGDVQLEDGRVITVEELDFNGQRVAVVDLDHDGIPDVAMSDLNHNNQADEGEVIDLHTGEALTFTNDTVDTNDDLPVFDA